MLELYVLNSFIPTTPVPCMIAIDSYISWFRVEAKKDMLVYVSALCSKPCCGDFIKGKVI